MLKRRLAQHMTHGRRLQRHLARRQLAVRQVYATTAMPFLQRVGLVTAPPSSLHPAHPSHVADNLVLIDEIPVPLADTLDLEQLELGETQADAAAWLGSISSASAENEVAPADSDSTAETAPPQPVSAVVPADPAPRVVPDENHSQSSLWQALKKKVAAKLASEAYARPANVEPQAVPAQPQPVRPSEPAKSVQADQAELPSDSGASPKPAELPASQPGAASATAAAANDADQVAQVARTQAAAPVPQETSDSEITAAEPVPASASQPEVVSTTTAARRRAQIQEVRPESKPQAATPAPRPARSTKSQTRAGSFPNLPHSSPPPESDKAKDLFAPREEADRSPAAWLEKLGEAIRVERENESKQAAPPAAKNVAPDPPSQVSKPAAPRNVNRSVPARRINSPPRPLSESARRLLTPLVGFDPRDVEVQEGPEVSRALGVRGADAMASSDSILLGPGHPTEAPKTLAVLGHELTHIGRGREARFVPPVARTSRPSSAAAHESIPETADEEALARRVESQVEQVAKARDGEAGDQGNVPGALPPRASQPASPIAFPGTKSKVPPDGTAADDSWGGLPAPWEPMPAWVTAPAEEQPALAGPAVVGPAPSAGAPAASAGPPAAPALAETGRSLPEAAEAPRSAEAHEHPKEAEHPAPDLDALARQVYSVVRRRLAADRRREFM